MKEQIRVLIVDDHPIFRHGLSAMIERDAAMKIVGEAGDGAEALKIIPEKKPDVIILDVDMPVMDGIRTAEALRDGSCPARIIFLTMLRDKSVLRSLRTLQVQGYVLKDSAINEIVKCIRAVLAGKSYLSPALNDLILDNLGEDTDSEVLKMIGGLTSAEKKVLSLITESKTNREIAEELFVSIRTVESHRYRICQKLDLNGVHALLMFAIKNKKKILDQTSN